MSSGNPGGAPNLKLKAKHAPTYPPSAIKSERDADFTGAGPGAPTGIKLGIRVKKKSLTDFQTPTLILTTRATPGHPGTPIPLTGPLPDTDPIVADLTAGLGCDANEKWFAYTLNWNPALGLKFDSTLTLNPFPYPPFVTDNGFEIVTVAFCHASQNFTTGVYTYAVSVLPGKNSSGLPMSIPEASTGKKSTKKPKKKAAKKAKAKSKKKYRR
jgi:hypothetical protein